MRTKQEYQEALRDVGNLVGIEQMYDGAVMVSTSFDNNIKLLQELIDNLKDITDILSEEHGDITREQGLEIYSDNYWRIRKLIMKPDNLKEKVKPTNVRHIGNINDCRTGETTKIIRGNCKCGFTVYCGDNFCKECGSKLDWLDNLKENE